MEIIEKIEETAEIEDEMTGKLKNNIKITKVTVDTFGKEYKLKKYNQNWSSRFSYRNEIFFT